MKRQEKSCNEIVTHTPHDNRPTENSYTSVENSYRACTSNITAGDEAQETAEVVRNEAEEGCSMATSQSLGKSRTVTSTPYQINTSTRTQFMFSITPDNTASAQLELIGSEERSLTSLLNITLEEPHPTQTHDESDQHDSSFGMVTLVRPSIIPEDHQISPSKQIMELQRCIIKANNKVSELEAEKRELRETTKDLQIQLNITNSMVEEMKNQPNKSHPSKTKTDSKELKRKIADLEQQCLMKAEENKRLLSNVSELEINCLAMKEENELLSATIASLQTEAKDGYEAHGTTEDVTVVDAIGSGKRKPNNSVNLLPCATGPQDIGSPSSTETETIHQGQNLSGTKIRPFRGASDPLSNYYQVKGEKIHFKGQHFISSEQAYQHTKALFHGQKQLAKDIRSVTDPHLIRKMGSIKESVAWRKEKEGILRDPWKESSMLYRF